ncbi:hypothetical protein CEUSTIGMA_g12183.t1 [Chlamydomonas eustigma]|uniref:DNA topoisomerase 2 n=1 Tax=Chlamydomonas eustigma TaxID=1157962 RepID=A0A250XNU3_9CHLO|nr:hypothetical protein CEUSTIGMA_g12183.t1 [Chlamydomonas eustigma]|eukprot:GAX84761.1 hypothetical protein CEUSTIGMA_g12183.t1 [Chlamydomonas eustigma]
MEAAQFKRLSHREHVLLRPDMYVGPTTPETTAAYVLGAEKAGGGGAEKGGGMVLRTDIQYVPALLKIFDEILVNAIDHCVRSRQMQTASDDVQPTKRIDVSIGEDGSVTVSNDGDGIPVERTGDGMYVPELIFGHLLTSANYDDAADGGGGRTIGGQNGIGAKACNILSKYFEVDVVDRKRGLRFRQRFEHNMSVTLPPEVEKSRLKRSYTTVKAFDKYVGLFLAEGQPHAYARVAGWEIAAAFLEEGTGLRQVSFVNGVATLRGGRHVDHVVQQISRRLCDLVEKRRKGGGGSGSGSPKPQYVKDNLLVFVRATVPNPKFDSQAKETLTTPVSQFGQKVEVPDAFVEKLYRIEGLVVRLVGLSGVAMDREAKKSDGSKRARVSVPKLEDAEWAGTGRSDKCTLILTEGDSAKASAVSGMSVVGRDRFGVFPLRGKVLNVCDVSADKVSSNAEISAIKKILGLQTGKAYASAAELRYGRVMLMTDADTDGSHIKGLVMNLFMQQWPSLLRLDGFFCALLTPVVKAFFPPPRPPLEFYNASEFEAWRQENPGLASKCNSKYYKGLGTSTAEEAREWFRRMRIRGHAGGAGKGLRQEAGRRPQGVAPHVRAVQDDRVRQVRRALLRLRGARAGALQQLRRAAVHPVGGGRAESVAAEGNTRVLQAEAERRQAGDAGGAARCLRRGGHLLPPRGGVHAGHPGVHGAGLRGQRQQRPAPVANRAVRDPPRGREADADVLTTLTDDGVPIEPKHFLPVLPIVLLNGATGIGTGYSTTVPSYNPREVADAVRAWIDRRGERWMEGRERLEPWCAGHLGKIEATGEDLSKRRSRGVVTRSAPKAAVVSELPIGMWTDDFREALEALVERCDDIRSFSNESSEATVRFTVQFSYETAADSWLARSATDERLTRLEAELRMVGTRGLGTGNMHLFNARSQIQRFESAEQILEAFCEVRLEGYVRRRQIQIARAIEEACTLKNRVRFVELVVDGSLNLHDEHVEKAMEAVGLMRKYDHSKEDQDHSKEDQEDHRKDDHNDRGYGYLLSMPMRSMTHQRLSKLRALQDEKQRTVEALEADDALQMWRRDIDYFMAVYDGCEKKTP